MLAHVYLKKGCVVPKHSHMNDSSPTSWRVRCGPGGEDGARRSVVRAGEVLHLPGNLPHEPTRWRYPRRGRVLSAARGLAQEDRRLFAEVGGSMLRPTICHPGPLSPHTCDAAHTGVPPHTPVRRRCSEPKPSKGGDAEPRATAGLSALLAGRQQFAGGLFAFLGGCAMNFRFKLSRRLARIKPGVLIAGRSSSAVASRAHP